VGWGGVGYNLAGHSGSRLPVRSCMFGGGAGRVSCSRAWIRGTVAPQRGGFVLLCLKERRFGGAGHDQPDAPRASYTGASAPSQDPDGRWQTISPTAHWPVATPPPRIARPHCSGPPSCPTHACMHACMQTPALLSLLLICPTPRLSRVRLHLGLVV
jgi:hypothetical protein